MYRVLSGIHHKITDISDERAPKIVVDGKACFFVFWCDVIAGLKKLVAFVIQNMVHEHAKIEVFFSVKNRDLTCIRPSTFRTGVFFQLKIV